MQKKFIVPHKKGSNIYMVEVLLIHQSLVCRDEYFKRFEAYSIVDLKKNVVNYCKAYGLVISEMSDIFVVHEETTYSKLEGFNLCSDTSMKGVMLR